MSYEKDRNNPDGELFEGRKDTSVLHNKEGSDFAERLKTYRRKRGRSQDWMAERLHTTRKMIWRYETGRSAPSSDQVVMICRVLDITPNQLFGIEKMVYPSDSDELFRKEHLMRVLAFAEKEYDAIARSMKKER